MTVYSEYLDHVGASQSQPKAGRITSTHKSNDYLMTGILIRAVICLAFVAVGAVYSLV
jgi:hypothetical protein